MNSRHRTQLRVTAILGGSAVIAAAAAFPAVAASGDVDVVNAETVSVYTDAAGKVESKRVYEQLALTGNGSVDLANPVIDDGLRNLDGFGGFDVEDGVQQVNLEVDGEKNLRTVSNYDGDLPLELSIAYELDGERIDPSDLVGRSGDLEVTYTVENVTGQTQTVTVDDGKGGTVEREVEVILPMVGSLTTTLPSSFREVATPQGNLAGDGKGNTKLSFTMTLLAPVGSDTAEFTYTAKVADAVVPDSAVTALPVNPLEVPSFKSAGESYQGGAATGAELAAGATTIDGNLLQLRDGAAELLAGIVKLRAGADQLSEGLNETAVPGSRQLADGADDLRGGLLQIDDGAGRLADGSRRLDAGAGELAAGTQDAAAGGRKLRDGLGQISGGLGQLSGKLPGAQDGIKQLKDGVDQLLAGIGTPGNRETLLGGLTALNAGLGQLSAGSGDLVGGLQLLAGTSGGLGELLAGAQGLQSELQGAGAPLAESIGQLKGLADAIAGDPGCQTSEPCVARAQTLSGGLTQLNNELDTQLATAAGGAGQIAGGLQGAIAALDTRLIPGAQQIQGGLAGPDGAQAGAAKLLAGAERLQGGTQQVRNGLDELAVGITDAVTGVMQLSDGADDAYGGSGDLSDGLGRLADGAGTLEAGTGELSSGAGELAAGTGTAADGSGRLADGAGELADGLGTAADGSGQIADGLGEAAKGAPQIVDGAGRLSEEGTSKLVEAGQATAIDYGEMYAVLEAGAERAQAEKMVVGAPEDAIGLAAYSYEIQGEDGEGGRNVSRGLVGLTLLGAGAGVFALRRRFI